MEYLYLRIRFILIFVLLLTTNDLKAQAPIQTIIQNDDGIIFTCNLLKIEIIDSLKTAMYFDYILENRSKSDIYSVGISGNDTTNILLSNNIIDIGGLAVNFRLGYESLIYKKLKPGRKISGSHKVIILNKNADFEPIYKIDANGSKIDSKYFYFGFIYGYYLNEDNEKIKKYLKKDKELSNSDMYRINTEKDNFGFIFDSHFKRKLSVFPIALYEIK